VIHQERKTVVPISFILKLRLFSILLFLQILHFLGNEGPRTSDPSIYIRYIYNRVILENATVRASAVSTLAKFGALVDTLKV
jgi:hypothetical protein